MATKPQIWITPLHIAEWIARSGAACFPEGNFHSTRRGWLPSELERDLGNGLWLDADLPDAGLGNVRRPGPQTWAQASACGLWIVCTWRRRIEFGAKAFWTFDERQAKLAAAVGLATS